MMTEQNVPGKNSWSNTFDDGLSGWACQLVFYPLTRLVCVMVLVYGSMNPAQAAAPDENASLSMNSTLSNSRSSKQKSRVFVDVRWLRQHRKDGIILVDARNRQAYLDGHIPGAVNIFVDDTFHRIEEKASIGNLKTIQSLFSNAGIQHGKTIVIYAGDDVNSAGRVFWVFEVFDHQDVHILDGGIVAWQQAGNQPLSTKRTIVAASQYVPTVAPEKLVTLLSMRLAVSDRKKAIIDVRTRDEFRGITSKSGRKGHIPGAINIPVQANFTEKNGIKTLKPLSALKQLYSHVEGRKIVTYCNKGKDAALTYTILRALGEDVSVYDGSWFEWGQDRYLPIVEGDASSLPPGGAVDNQSQE